MEFRKAKPVSLRVTRCYEGHSTVVGAVRSVLAALRPHHRLRFGSVVSRLAEKVGDEGGEF
ncbi:hypothetical protein SAMN05443287_10112 [Micromonospora phaseoli]|uniref:Uncharacterized protein n=1 Tax=Micromonospora phaseoli TaxID=1144548 RepID=A0A1H6RA41_9ACTN|nr:hypothetical protein CLV64_10112 [Micromonospora phaseoli]GIJ78396.1 hypothetical protein Xph01_28280 [Micromonospora phaseoli]SEI50104.1 hypothetical protein SAMN05443287_10112 [Micromonospora phaseoli]